MVSKQKVGIIGRLRLRTKLLIGILFVEALLLSSTVLVVENQMRDSILNEFLKRGLSITKNLAAVNKDYVTTYNYVQIDQNLEHVVKENNLLYAMVVFFDGEVASYKGPHHIKEIILAGLLQEKTREIHDILIQYKTYRGEAFYEIAVPIFLEEEYWAIVSAGFSLNSLHAAVFKTRKMLLGIGVIGLVCGWLASVYLARRITRPIYTLVESVKAISKGQYHHPICVNTHDEIGYLGQRFSTMQEMIKRQFQELLDTNDLLSIRNHDLQHEIAQRHKKEIALRESEARLANAQRIAKLGFWEWNKKANKVFCSVEMSRQLGILPQDGGISHRILLKFVPKEERPLLQHAIRQAVARKASASVEHHLTPSQGGKRVVGQEIEASFDDIGKVIRLVGTLQDITERKHAIERMHYLAYYDNVTTLPNRALLVELLNQWIRQAKRYNRTVAVLFLDLDHFKRINDTLGHKAGDELLRGVARRLSDSVRDSDVVMRHVEGPPTQLPTWQSNNTVARLGGDEFVVVLTNLSCLEDASIVARRINDRLSRPFSVEETEVVVSSSIGISAYPTDGDNVEDLIKHADLAMYHAKAKGRNGYQFFTSSMNAYVQDRLSIENHLRESLGCNHFILYYQPKVNTRTGQIVGMEALIRWRHPERGFVSPATFISIAEETGLIIPLGEWVLRRACAQAKAWQQAGLPPLRVSVNLSVAQFKHAELQNTVIDALADAKLKPEYLELELTESLLMENLDTSVAQLEELKAIGVYLSIDDFGTGYSSLSYLKRFPIDALKIDRSFIQDIATDASDATIVTATINLGHNLGHKVIAEGVETQAQLEFLRMLQCDEIQGYLLSKPLPPKQFFEYVQHQLHCNDYENFVPAMALL